MKQPISTDRAPAPRGPYSQGIIASGPQLFIAAQGPFDPETGAVAGEAFALQAERVFLNLRLIAAAAGATLADAVKVTVYLADWKYFAEMNEVYRRYFPEPFPARSPVVGPMSQGLIMADAVLSLPDQSRD